MPRIANRLLIWNAAADLVRLCSQQLAKVVELNQGAEHMLPVNAVRADLWEAALDRLSSQQVYRNLGPACEEAPPPALNKGAVPATGRQTSTDGARQFYWLASKGHLEVAITAMQSWQPDAAMQDIIAAQDLNVDEIRFDVVETLREVHGPLYWRVFNTGTVGTNAPMVEASSAVLQAAKQFNWLAPGLASFCRNEEEFFILKAFSLDLGRQNIHQMDQIFTALATPRTPVLGLQLALVGLEEEPHVHSLPHDRFSRFAEDACVAMGSLYDHVTTGLGSWLHDHVGAYSEAARLQRPDVFTVANLIMQRQTGNFFSQIDRRLRRVAPIQGANPSFLAPRWRMKP